MKRITEKNSKKKKSKKNIRLIIVGIFAILILALFAIRILPTIRSIEITIENSENEEARITKEQVLELAGIKVGDKLYKELRSQIETRIEANPYIETAKISRNLSGKVAITVTQRKPEYLINYAGEYIYIDKEGYVLEINPENNGTPVLIGLTTDFSELSIGNSKIRLGQSDLEKLDNINNILGALRSNGIENTITSIDLSDKKNYILTLGNDGKEIYLGDGTDINAKALYIKKILEAEAGNSGTIYLNR